MNNQKLPESSDIHRRPTRIGEGLPPIGKGMPELEEYKIIREIGRGGMAVVYEAMEKSLNRVVALKVLGKELTQDTELIHRFINEAQAAARISHPNIVQIYSIGEEEEFSYFAMEYVRGKSVESMLADGKRIPVKQCISIIRQTVYALQEAYKNNIIHRDIKPGNLLVNEQGIVKVADFGLAGEVKGAQTFPGGKIIGTPLYISPEQAQGRTVDFRSDIYSLGITFYQMLSGTPPFISADTKILMDSHIEKEPPPLPTDIPKAVRKLVNRMADKNPEKRFQSYESLIKELDGINRMLSRKKYTMPLLSLALVLSTGIAIYSFYYKPIVEELVLPIRIDKDKRIEAIYDGVVQYARKHPEAHGDVIKEYFKIIREFPDTEWAYRAEQKIDMIILAVAREAAVEVKELKTVCDKLIAENRYKEAIDRYKVVKDKYRDTAAGSFAQENMNYILDVARKDFNSKEEQAGAYLSQYKFNDARKLYEEVISNYGIEEFVKVSQERLRFIDEVEAGYRVESEAKNVLKPVQTESEKLIKEHKYDEARQLFKSIQKTDENPLLSELVKKELDRIDEIQIEYESSLLKEKMDSQYNYYDEINKKVEGLIKKYNFKESMELVKEGIRKVEVLEWRSRLEILQERLGYLVVFKDGIIDGINKELNNKKVTDINADEGTLIFVVKGGYVGAPWTGTSSIEIYRIAKRYLRDNAQMHMAMGVFCLINNLPEDARKEFAKVLRTDPDMKGAVEKYLIQLAEDEKAASK